MSPAPRLAGSGWSLVSTEEEAIAVVSALPFVDASGVDEIPGAYWDECRRWHSLPGPPQPNLCAHLRGCCEASGTARLGSKSLLRDCSPLEGPRCDRPLHGPRFLAEAFRTAGGVQGGRGRSQLLRWRRGRNSSEWVVAIGLARAMPDRCRPPGPALACEACPCWCTRSCGIPGLGSTAAVGRGCLQESTQRSGAMAGLDDRARRHPKPTPTTGSCLGGHPFQVFALHWSD